MTDNLSSVAEPTSTLSDWLNRLISAIVGIAVAVVGALIIGKVQAHEPHLVYSLVQSFPFRGSNGEVSIYQVTISNDGKREVYDVACMIRIPLSKIDQHVVTADPLLSVSEKLSGDSLSIQIPNLNPSESVQVSLLGSGAGTPARPQIALRGRGTLGLEKTTDSERPWIDRTWWVPTVLALVSAMLASQILTSRSRSGDQKENLAFVCRTSSLSDLADGYSARSHGTTSYWAEADRLGQIALDAGGERMILIERALSRLIEYAHVAQTSKAVVYYNLALINRAKKDQGAYTKYLQLAKKTSRDEIDRRLKVDPRFT